MRKLFAALRIIVAAAITAAVVGQLVHSLGVWEGQGVKDTGFQIVNFFSFFTIESNIGAIVALLLGAWFGLSRSTDPQWFTVFRAVITTYMATTFVVYNLLLRNVELPQGATLGWSNEILHVVGPLLVVLDWLLAPGRKPIAWKSIWIIVAFPIVWAGYTLIRGPIAIDERTGAGWYPYPFLNPDTSANGYLSVAFYVILIAAVIGLVGAGVIWVSRRKLPAFSRDGEQ